MNRITYTFWRYWPYLATGLLGLLGIAAIYSGSGDLFVLILVGIPAVIFLMRSPVAVIITQFAFNVVALFLTGNMNLNGSLIYFTDLLTALLLLQIIINYQQLGYKLRILALPAIILALLFTVNIISAVYNRVNLINFIWGMRLNYRFVVFTVGCVMFINRRVVEIIWKLMISFTALQGLICSVQYFFLNYENADEICGTFGRTGSNHLVCFLAIAFIFSYLRFAEGKCRASVVWAVFLLSLYICIINEGKAYFFFALVILGVIVFQNGVTVRKILWMVGVVAGCYMFTLLLQDLYPSFRDFFNTDVVREYTAEGVYFGAKINRFNGIQFFSPRLDSFQNFFGVGLGNAAESSIPALQGEYYKLYYLVRYSWFYIAYFYLEGGYIGLSLNIAYLLSFLVVAYRIRNNISKNYLAYFVGMVLICLFTTGYFNALRLEIGYILYLFLSIPMAIAVDESRE